MDDLLAIFGSLNGPKILSGPRIYCVLMYALAMREGRRHFFKMFLNILSVYESSNKNAIIAQATISFNNSLVLSHILNNWLL